MLGRLAGGFDGGVLPSGAAAAHAKRAAAYCLTVKEKLFARSGVDPCRALKRRDYNNDRSAKMGVGRASRAVSSALFIARPVGASFAVGARKGVTPPPPCQVRVWGVRLVRPAARRPYGGGHSLWPPPLDILQVPHVEAACVGNRRPSLSARVVILREALDVGVHSQPALGG